MAFPNLDFPQHHYCVNCETITPIKIVDRYTTIPEPIHVPSKSTGIGVDGKIVEHLTFIKTDIRTFECSVCGMQSQVQLNGSITVVPSFVKSKV